MTKNISKNIFSFELEWNYKTISLFFILLALPNFLGMLNISTGLGFNVHFFQLAIFLAAFIYGPIGGLASGALGSVYSAVAMHNPYIVLFNIVLGFFAGLFFRKGIAAIGAVMLAFLIELPLIYFGDIYLMHMPVRIVGMLLVALLVSNAVWGFAAGYSTTKLKNFIS